MTIDTTKEVLMPTETRKAFILGGKAIFTLAYDQNAVHYTYQIKKADKRNENDPDIYFVGVLTGPDNYNDYRYAGIIRDKNTMEIRASAKSKIALTAPSMVILTHFLSTFDPNIQMYHVGNCGICGKRLTDPVSIALGIGPICREKGF